MEEETIMIIVTPSAKMIKPGEESFEPEEFTAKDGLRVLRFVEYCARISHRSEERQTMETYDQFLRSVVMGHGDQSVTEHIVVNVELEVDRGITHEIVRHRIGAYTQESTRFVNYNKPGYEPRAIKPATFNADNQKIWEDSISDSFIKYQLLIEGKITPQIARSVLPNALASKIMVTYNLRMWRHFFLMRTSMEAHPQAKVVSIPLLFEFQEKIPILFEDIKPGMRQADNLRMLR